MLKHCISSTGQYKECYDLLKEIADVRPSVIFQSEDLSLFQMTPIQTSERSDSPVLEFQSQNAQAESSVSGDVNKISGERQAESTRCESPAVEVRSEDIDNTETQTQSEASGDGDEDEDVEETVDIKAPMADLH